MLAQTNNEWGLRGHRRPCGDGDAAYHIWHESTSGTTATYVGSSAEYDPCRNLSQRDWQVETTAGHQWLGTGGSTWP